MFSLLGLIEGLNSGRENYAAGKIYALLKALMFLKVSVETY
jgi:hypothetical protein